MSDENILVPGIEVLTEAWTPGDILYYGPVTRTIALFGDIGRDTSLALVSQILELDYRDSESPITLYINTDGGTLSDALAIYDCLRGVEAPIITMTLGTCASAGLLVLSAGDIRLSSENTLFFYHQPILPSEGFTSGDQIGQTYHAYNICQETYDNIIIKRSKIKKSIWNKEFKGKIAKYFTASEALGYKIIDGIIPKKKKSTKITME